MRARLTCYPEQGPDCIIKEIGLGVFVHVCACPRGWKEQTKRQREGKAAQVSAFIGCAIKACLSVSLMMGLSVYAQVKSIWRFLNFFLLHLPNMDCLTLQTLLCVFV